MCVCVCVCVYGVCRQCCIANVILFILISFIIPLADQNKVPSSSRHLLPVQFTRLRHMVEEEVCLKREGGVVLEEVGVANWFLKCLQKRRRLIEQSDQLLQSLQG